MFALKSFVRSAAVVLALTVPAIPSIAMAGPEKPEKGDHQKHFPMPAARFKDAVEKRIAHARAHLEKKLDEHNVTGELRTRIEKEFDAGAGKIRDAAAKAEADGTVTKDEAEDVRDLAKRLRKEAKEKMKRTWNEKKDQPKK